MGSAWFDVFDGYNLTEQIWLTLSDFVSQFLGIRMLDTFAQFFLINVLSYIELFVVLLVLFIPLAFVTWLCWNIFVDRLIKFSVSW